MNLFGKREAKPVCTCGETGSGRNNAADALVLILGCGCGKSRQLEATVRAALAELGSDAALELVTDSARIAACGVMTTPALVVNGRVVSSGRVLKTEEVVKLLRESL